MRVWATRLGYGRDGLTLGGVVRGVVRGVARSEFGLEHGGADLALDSFRFRHHFTSWRSVATRFLVLREPLRESRSSTPGMIA
jgi:hypothetical protein